MNGLRTCPRCKGAGRIDMKLKDYQEELLAWIELDPLGITIAELQALYAARGETLSHSAVYGRLMRLGILGLVRPITKDARQLWRAV